MRYAAAMNYRHAFHAANHADVLKHLVLIETVERVLKKPSAAGMLDVFAGAGAYDLAGPEAQRSPEWRDGVAKLQGWRDAPASVAALLSAMSGECYPGSPAILQQRLRPQDSLTLCELHPEEAAKLRAAVGGDPRVRIHERDGFAALSALTPLQERRGVVLIDPPYEAPDELPRATTAIKAAVRRFRQGVYLWWRPEKPNDHVDRADRELLQDADIDWLCARLAVADPTATSRLVASSMLILNPPFGLQQSLLELLPVLWTHLDQGGGGWRLTASADRA